MIKLDLPTRREIIELYNRGHFLYIESDFAKSRLKPSDSYAYKSIWLKDGSIASFNKDDLEIERINKDFDQAYILPVIRDRKVYNLFKDVDTLYVSYLEFPFFAVHDEDICNELNREIDKDNFDYLFTQYYTHPGYFYKGNIYIRVWINHEYVWFKVIKVKWVIDHKLKLLISKYPWVGGMYFKSNTRFEKYGVRYTLDLLEKELIYNSLYDERISELNHEYKSSLGKNCLLPNNIALQTLMNIEGIKEDELIVDGLHLQLKK